MKIVNPFFPIISLVLFFSATAQKNNLKIKFGDVKPGDFTPAVYMVDSSANAVILADIGSSSFDGSSGGDFVLVYNQHKRIRIMNKNGYSAATIEIPLYVNENEEEKIANLEAVTYNLENGQVVATKLDKASEFKEKYSAHYVIEKFTFPNLKEGSIIEYHYSIISIAGYYSNLRAWDFQGNLPCLWSEYAVTIPIDIFDYVIFKQGYLPYAVDTSSSSHKTYAINYNRPNAILRNSIYSTTVTARWAMQDVPSLKPENYITSLDNYKARIDFQLNSIRYSETNVVEYMGNWKQMAERMMKREDFGMAINADNTWMNDDLKGISASTADDYLKAKKVYEYLRDNFTCTKYYGLFVTTTLKKVFENKSGSVSDINLLLVAALKHLNFEASPVILSTRKNGLANETYPLMEKFNYVICRVKIGDKYYLLDATENKLGFGKLPEYVYNHSGRIVDTDPVLINLSADSLNEVKIVSLFAVNEENKIAGTLNIQYGDFESADMRKKLLKIKSEDYLKEIQQEYSRETEISNIEIEPIETPELPLEIKYDIKFGLGDEDIIYFNPVIANVKRQNPFKSAERYYPVEMSSCTDETYVLNMEVPKGFKIEELPKSTRVMLNKDDGMFEYIISGDGGHIQLRCRIVLKKATFEPEDYTALRDFFRIIIQKEAEQVVFKKIK